MNALSQPTRGDAWKPFEEREVEVPHPHGGLGARLYLPAEPRGAVILAHPSSIARLGRNERFLAGHLAHAGFLTLLVDLLTEQEDEVRLGAHLDVPLLAGRLIGASRWLGSFGASTRLPLGYFGVGTGAAAALVATAIEPQRALAVVSRESSPAAAGASLLLTRVPTLFISAGNDAPSLAAHRRACGQSSRRRLEIVPSAHGDFVEGEALDRVAALSANWFAYWLDPSFQGG